MIILSVLRRGLFKLGIGHSHEQCPFSTRNINLAVIWVFIICTATSFLSIVLEYRDLKIVFGSFYVTMSGLLNIISYVHVVCQKPKLLNFIDELEQTVEESKIQNFIKKFPFIHKMQTMEKRKIR